MPSDPQFLTHRVQADPRYRTGLWACIDDWLGGDMAIGPKGKINQLAKLLNDKEVTVICEVVQD